MVSGRVSRQEPGIEQVHPPKRVVPRALPNWQWVFQPGNQMLFPSFATTLVDNLGSPSLRVSNCPTDQALEVGRFVGPS